MSPDGKAVEAEAAHHLALDPASAAVLDQLLGDRPEQRLPGDGAPQGPVLEAAAEGPAEQRIVTECPVEIAEVIVDPEAEPQPGNAGCQRFLTRFPKRAGARTLQ